MHESSGVVKRNKKCFIFETRNRKIIWPVRGCAVGNQRKHGETIKDSDKVRIWSLLHYFIITRNMLLKDDQFLSLCYVNKISR